MKDLRKVFRFEQQQWKKIDFKDLKKGDIFKLYESDNIPVRDLKGETEWVASCDAYLNEEEVWTIKIDE